MPLLTAPEAPTRADGFIADDGLFKGGLRLDGGGNPAYEMTGNSALGLIDQAHAGYERLDSETRSVADSVYSPGDLTLYSSNIIDQRHSPLIAEQAFGVHGETKGSWYEYVDTLRLDEFGQADYYGAGGTSKDIPIIDLDGKSFKCGFADIAIGYRISYKQQQQQRFSRRIVPIQSTSQRVCTLALRQKAEQIAFRGSPSRQVLGLLNNPAIPRQIASAPFDDDLTTEQIKQEIARARTQLNVETDGAAQLPDAMIGSRRRITYMQNRTFSTDGNNRDSLMQAAFENSTIQNIFASGYMERVGLSKAPAFFFYRRSLDCIGWHYPIVSQALPPFLYNGMELVQIFIARIGCVWPTRPEDCLLLTNI